MKILAIVTTAPGARACLDAATVASRVHPDALVEALHVIVDPEKLIAPPEEIEIQRYREQQEGTAADRAQAVEVAIAKWQADAGPETPIVKLREPVGAEEANVLKAGAEADLLVLANCHDLESGDARHAVIRRLHRPLLLVPIAWTPRARKFAHIAVALSDTPVTDDAIAGALPWLLAADKVTALRIGGDGDRALAHVDQLRDAGIQAGVRIFPPVGNDRGAQIVMEAKAIGADALVAGAYRHSQLVEWLMGGTTRHMLAATELPLMLAH